MSVDNQIYKVLESKKDHPVYPELFDGNINSIIDYKEREYDDIIRMNTSDRNKAKSTMSVLNTVYYHANITLQLLYSVLKDDLNDISSDETNYIIGRTTEYFKELDSVIFEEGVTNIPMDDNKNNIRKIVSDFVKLYGELLKATISISNTVYNLRYVVDIIVHGEITGLINSSYPNSKLVTAYIEHLSFVNDELRKNPVTYLKNIIEFNDKLDK